ncbi:MAG: ABC transporter substrate-binding protein [Flavobacteriaceae bacterium]|nr:ABC transporter substrate-binding protein [Flavobacteriaceae bacterium]MDH3795703.1 ABC transporter substrate-binding protein [Flavobacteriaceae bacterium]
MDKEKIHQSINSVSQQIKYARGFQLTKQTNGTTLLQITSPWPGADKQFSYLLVPKDIDLEKDSLATAVDALIPVPVGKYIATSTTHIPALESLGALDGLVGFPGTQYVSSEKARAEIDSGHIQELGANESLNTEMTLVLDPEIVFGFSISDKNSSYEFLEDAGIPVIYNGDWTENSPLGKAEWIRFFAPFFGKEKEADSIFSAIETNYLEAKLLASGSQNSPRVMSGALYKDVWYLPGGDSWAAQFIEDANGEYIWAETQGTGSLSLSMEHVLERASNADVWISPSQFTSTEELLLASPHYAQFKPLKQKRIYTYALNKGVTGGLIYFESAPQRPDLVLKDLIHIFHPDLLPKYQPHFFSPLE